MNKGSALEIAHFNREELAAMDKVQGGRVRDHRTGLPVYRKLSHLLLNHPDNQEHLEEVIAAGHEHKAGRETHLSRQLEEMREHGRHGDSELALIPKPLSNMLDHMIGSVSHNPEDGHKEYFWGSLLSLGAKVLPTILKTASTVGRAALPALKTIGQGVVKYAPKVMKFANDTGLTNMAGQYLMSKVMPQSQPEQPQQQYQQEEQAYSQPEPQHQYHNQYQQPEYHADYDNYNSYPQQHYSGYQEQYQPEYGNGYHDDYSMNGYAGGGGVRHHYSQGGEIAGGILGTLMPGADYLVNAIDEFAHGQPHLTASDQYRMAKRQAQSDQAQNDIINNVNAKTEAYENHLNDQNAQAIKTQGMLDSNRDYARSSRDAVLSRLKNRQDKMMANGLIVAPEGRYQDPSVYKSDGYYRGY